MSGLRTDSNSEAGACVERGRCGPAPKAKRSRGVYGAEEKGFNGVRWCSAPKREENGKKYYQTAELESFEEGAPSFRISCGDMVHVCSGSFTADGEEHLWVMKIDKLYEDPQEPPGERRRFEGTWFYKLRDTILAIDRPGMPTELPIDETIGGRAGLDPRRVWIAEEGDNKHYQTDNSLSSVFGKVVLRYVYPGEEPPLEGIDYWYSQAHTREYYTFRDVYPPGYGAPTRDRSSENSPQRVIQALDLFCGAGGLSFLAQEGRGVKIVCKHAVDLNSDALASFKVNHPDSNIHEMGVEEFLHFCKNTNNLYDRHDLATESPKTSVRVVRHRLHHNISKVREGQGKGQLSDSLSDENTSLQFCVRKGGAEKWVPEEGVPEAAMASFLRRLRRSKAIPIPQEVDLIMGGPPCQGVSGLNRHAAREDVLSCFRNRQVKAFFQAVDYFKPAFVLMENVQDIFRKEDGAYAKYATAQLLSLGYQSRMGLVAAGDQGCAQGRWRCLLWGARSGEEVLPPFPEPAFRVFNFRTAVTTAAKSCVVGFLSEASRKAAHPMVLNGDLLTDLPRVTNFCMAESQSYAREPQKPMQAWLRRDPPKGTPSWSERSRSALLKMNKTLLARMEMLRSAGNLSELGKVALCKKGENNFAAEIRKAAIEEIKDRKEREAFAADLEANRRKFTRQLGKQIKDEMRKAEGSSGLLHDHIPLTCNADDFLRMCGVPKEPGANFRQMEGVVTHSDGTCCAGHTHAYRRNGRSACPGGGTLEKPRSTTSKEGRVDITDKGGWRGTKLEGCDSKTVLLPSGDLLCPRWCITYKGGKSDGRHGCFGRVDLFGIQPTVVTRAEPHNLQIVHPNEDRVLSIREMARCQGFPDYYTLVGTHGSNSKLKSLSRPEYIESRYCQIGNAVAPPVAAAMGRCLTLAASGEADPMRPVVAVPDQEMEKVLRQAIDNGLTFYATEMGEEGEAMELGDSAEEDNDLEQDDLD